MKINDPDANIIIFSNGNIVVSDFNNEVEVENIINRTLLELNKVDINMSQKRVYQNISVDEIDFLILKILQDEQGIRPISTYEIKDILNEKYRSRLKSLNKDDISQSTIHNRIKILENHDIILNYTVNFCPKKIGFKGKYYLRIKPKNPSKYNELAHKLIKNKDITDLFRIGEQYGLFAIIRVKDIEDYATFIRNLYNTEEIEDTYSNFVLDELIPYTNFSIF
jgi:DNA-binding Lrp family transcriptional regulator